MKMTNWANIKEKLAAICAIREHEYFAHHTSLHVGGEIRFAVFPSSRDMLAQIMQLLVTENVPHVVLGKGTNVLVSDDFFDGVAVILGDGMDNFTYEGNGIWNIEAGASLWFAVNLLAKNGFCGIENLAGIPGSIGGAVIMNAGAYGTSFLEHVVSIEMWTPDSDFCELSVKELNFSYRRVVLPEKSIVTAAKLHLDECDSQVAIARIEEVLAKRASTQPLHLRSAGCFFKNPDGKHAGKLIEETGLKGFRFGGAQVSLQHANFLVNAENATARDISALSDYVRDKVAEKFGIILETEVIKIGEF